MTEEELIQRTRTLIRKWDNVRIVGQGWAGDTRRGFQFNPIPTSTGAGGGGPPTTTGACCPVDGPCFISTQVVCEAGGGTYQGDNTDCDPDPCVSGCLTCEEAFGIDPIYVILSDVMLCSCIDPGGGTSYTMVDGHFPGGTDTGVNSTWTANNDFLSHWQGFTGNAFPTDPYCFVLSFGTNNSCSGEADGVNLSECIVNVSCLLGQWTVTIEHSGFGFIFQGTGCGTEADPILNEFGVCDGMVSPRQVGIGGQVVISTTP